MEASKENGRRMHQASAVLVCDGQTLTPRPISPNYCNLETRSQDATHHEIVARQLLRLRQAASILFLVGIE